MTKEIPEIPKIPKIDWSKGVLCNVKDANDIEWREQDIVFQTGNLFLTQSGGHWFYAEPVVKEDKMKVGK